MTSGGRFQGQSVVVTGAGRGIGRATAERFASEGARVALLARSQDQIEVVARSIADGGGEAFAIPADVADPSSVEVAMARVADVAGGIDVLVNNAGISVPAPFVGTDHADWNRVIEVNLYGAVHCARRVAETMIAQGGGGAIVNVSSIHGYRVEPLASAYDVAKGGLDQLTRALALELAPHGVRVNGVAPGFVDTQMSIDADGVNELHQPLFREHYVERRKIPLARAARPDEIAAAIAFLASRDASYVNGTILVVDGGLSITF